jgi:DNA-binding NarL/FixJ family response regulator
LTFFVSTTIASFERVELILHCTPDIRAVASVATGEEAIAYCQRERCDVLLMDLRLRPMSGLEAPAGSTTVTAGSFATPTTGSEHPASILRVIKT